MLLPYSFYWNSRLSKDRQDRINEWLKTLPPDQLSLLEDLLWDAKDEAQDEGD